MPLKIKPALGTDIRRLTLLSPSYAVLRAALAALWPAVRFVVKYSDDEGDLVTIACDDDLDEAVATAAAPILRLTLVA